MASRKLELYRAKRDFGKTAEPSGKAKLKASKRLRFVIQKHAATRLHYDLRLELDGVFKSWAVTKGPSLDPKVRRLAVEVEDHPLDYGDFEGTIPKGQYGGGTVQLWDRGYWKPQGALSAQQMLQKGDLKFELEGDRLKGGWVLVRMRKDREGGKRTNWLLIKHRDGTEHDGDDDSVLAVDRSVASGRPMAEIAVGKGRKPKPFITVGSGAAADATWNSNRGDAAEARKATRDAGKSHPGEPKMDASSRGKPASTLPSFIEPQLCKLVDRPPAAHGWIHEVKFDGYRIQARVVDGAVSLRTRKGLDWTAKFPQIAKACARLDDGVIDGEIVALDSNGVPDFAGLQAALSDGKTGGLVLFAFDLLFGEKEDLRSLPLSTRKARLKGLLGKGKDSGLIRYVDHFDAAGDAVLKSACRLALEGIVSKQLSAPYRSGRGDSWTKAKCRAGHEVVIGGWDETDGRFRSLLVGVNKADHLIYVGKVGTGFSDAVMRKLMPLLNSQAASKNPFGGINAPKNAKSFHWVNPVLVAEVEFAGWTADGLVRQAAFKGLREDKPAADVVAERPDKKVRAATPSQPARRGTKTPKSPNGTDSHNSVVLGVPISHPEKSLWPASGGETAITKLDLARYYESVGPWMMNHLKGRPCSVIRAPDGITGEHFFQRHAMAGASSLIELVKVFGDHKPYLQVDRVEGLVALAQIAAVELHPWNCQPGQPELPGRFIFDLDPAPDVKFDAVVQAALELKDRLENLGLTPFCKTTGGKGLHVVTPFAISKRERIGWPEAKAIAHGICLQMANDTPQKYLVNMSKKARVGKIFLDYLRNDRMATAVAPLSTRARPRAPVSMPLNWAQVKKGLDPARFSLRTVPALLGKSTAWQDYCEGERPLMPVFRKLAAAAPKAA